MINEVITPYRCRGFMRDLENKLIIFRKMYFIVLLNVLEKLRLEPVYD